MLSSLIVKNGELLPLFDKYNYDYSVNIAEDVTQLEIYVVCDNENSKIVVAGNNNLTEKENLVTISVDLNDTITTYNLKVYKQATNEVASQKDNYTAVEIDAPHEINKFIAPIIGSCCFFAILVIFVLLFHKRKS